MPADKTSNLYEMSVHNCKKLLKNNVISLYQKAVDVLKNINVEAKLSVRNFTLEDRIESYPPRDVFTLHLKTITKILVTIQNGGLSIQQYLKLTR